ncbi:unnamed protein product [Microthlaspi erraticum]|uniref:MATH domain-containing protein n=1 Tax=Microthlaspi erraticum TaxID=1685480 RepID=A0A6D2L4X9_9BRAS|nr:unnamed protein product [Microthlaspi erraticum]
MGSEADKKFTWMIKNFSSFQSEHIFSDPFVVGGCKWRLKAFPKGNNNADHLSLYLDVAGSKSLPCGWRRHAKLSFTIVNQIPHELSVLRETQHWFDQKAPDWGFKWMFPLGKLKAKKDGFLVNGEVKIVAEIEVLEVIGKLDVPEEATDPLKTLKRNEDGAVSSALLEETPKDLVFINGFQVLSSQVDLARRVFEAHPETALECCTKNQELRTSNMNVLLSLIKMLFKWPQEHSEDDLYDAEAALTYMKSVGFKLDWLEKKLDELKENKKKCAHVCEIEQQLHDLELKCKDLKNQLNKEIKAEILEATAPDLSFNHVV